MYDSAKQWRALMEYEGNDRERMRNWNRSQES
jgi:hypothetical protein